MIQKQIIEQYFNINNNIWAIQAKQLTTPQLVCNLLSRHVVWFCSKEIG